jgi:hypothetical protein
MSEQDDRSAAARLFDIRRIIGGLFVLYGAILFVAGLVDGADAKEQAADIDINVWTGLAMLALGFFFLGWMWLRPLEAPEQDDEGGGDDAGEAGRTA